MLSDGLGRVASCGGHQFGIGDVHEAGVEFGGSAATYIGEGAVELDFEDVEHVLDAIGSAIGESPVEGGDRLGRRARRARLP